MRERRMEGAAADHVRNLLGEHSTIHQMDVPHRPTANITVPPVVVPSEVLTRVQTRLAREIFPPVGNGTSAAGLSS
jgi:hypothetical protein